jgi:hypothetical protein
MALQARHMWRLFEPIHALTYFTPEALAAYQQAGLRGYWRGYFAGRAAPLGAVEAAPVIACFYNFAPAMVQRAIPSVWSLATPAETLRARAAGAEAAMTRLFTDTPADAIAEATTLLEKASELLDPAGRVLGAANAALPIDPDASQLARLWQTTATLREHRGDGHVAALLAYGFDGCEAAVWRTEPNRDAEMQGFRGWTPDEWNAAIERLTVRGWLDSDRGHTEAGDSVYAAVEAATDRAAAQVWDELGTDATERLAGLLLPMAHAAFAVLPTENPIRLLPPPSV